MDGQLRPWTVEDSIAVRYFYAGTLHFASNSLYSGNPIYPSPDGEHLFFVGRHGDLQADDNVFEMQIFSVKAIKHAIQQRNVRTVKPLRTLTMRSRHAAFEYVAIGPAKWADNNTIVFLGLEGLEPRQLLRYDIVSGRLDRLSTAGQDVSAYELRGDSIVYVTQRPARAADPFESYPMVVVTGSELGEMLNRKSPEEGFGLGALFRIDRDRDGYRPPVPTSLAQDKRPIMRTNPTDRPKLAGGLTVTVREGPNDPPVVIASDGRQEIPLTPLDPALTGVARAKVQEVRWPEHNGRHIEAGSLFVPRTFDAAAPPPLVIQMYHDNAGRFLPDGGYTTTSFAAQALAAQGMAVLTMDTPGWDYFSLGSSSESEIPADLRNLDQHGYRKEEIQAFWDRIDAAVTYLAAKGLIDPKRVGLVSTQSTAAYALFAQPPHTTLGAAMFFDFTATVADELQHSGFSGTAMPSNRPGAFVENSSDWLERAPLFHLKRLNTPVFFQFNCSGRRSCVPRAAETVGAFRLARRPFEVALFPDGEEQMQLPRQRLASLTATVDWMNFWLQGKEDHAQSKQDAYARWRQMKADQVLISAIRTALFDAHCGVTVPGAGVSGLWGLSPSRAIRSFDP